MPITKKLKKKVPKGFVPTSFRQKNTNVNVTFTKFRFGIRQKFAKVKTKTKSFKIPKGFKVTSARTKERGLTPKSFTIKLQKNRKK